METSEQLLNIEYTTGLAWMRSPCVARFIGGGICESDVDDLNRYCFFHRFQHQPDGQCQLVITATHDKVYERCSRSTSGIMCDRHRDKKLVYNDE